MAEEAKERQIPLVLTLVGAALHLLAAFLNAGPSGVGPALIAISIGATLQTVLLIGAAFVVATVLGVSFGDAGSAGLKFAGAVLLSGGIGALIPMGGLIALFIFLGLVMWLFEIELTYAIALTVVYFLVSFVVAMMLRASMG